MNQNTRGSKLGEIPFIGFSNYGVDKVLGTHRLTDSLTDGHTRKQNASGTKGFLWRRLKNSQHETFYVISYTVLSKLTCIFSFYLQMTKGD